MTLAGILAESSNTGTVMVGQEMPKQVREDYLRKFGFGTKTGLGLPGESAGILGASKDWDGRKEYEVLFGQGVAVNAVQATSVFSTIANGGVRVDPTLLKGTTGPDGIFVPAPARGTTQVVSESTADQVLHMMEAVVEEGRAPRPRSTATASRARPGPRRRSGRRRADGHHGLLHRCGPGRRPAVHGVGVPQEPRSNIYGGMVAAPCSRT
ncbi:penicillin-binding transpeptidase domain-containing protein [Oerskovia sp. M15]